MFACDIAILRPKKAATCQLKSVRKHVRILRNLYYCVIILFYFVKTKHLGEKEKAIESKRNAVKFVDTMDLYYLTYALIK